MIIINSFSNSQISNWHIALKSEISKTDQKIDRTLNELFEFTEEEIRIVKGKIVCTGAYQ
jgi:hypothetical protein